MTKPTEAETIATELDTDAQAATDAKAEALASIATDEDVAAAKAIADGPHLSRAQLDPEGVLADEAPDKPLTAK